MSVKTSFARRTVLVVTVLLLVAFAQSALAGDKLFLTGFYDGSLMLELDQEKLAVRELWRRRGRNERNTDALHSTISTPVIIGEHIYGVDSYGELRCLRVSDGGRVWETIVQQ